MGLLPIKSGEIFVDDVKITEENFSTLKNLTGYVPQEISLLEDNFKIMWHGDKTRIILMKSL